MKTNDQRGTPEWIAASTGNASIDRAFEISVALVENLTRRFDEFASLQNREAAIKAAGGAVPSPSCGGI